MKTQVIQLAEEDDFISIRDRMEWAKTPRILLVWPLDGKVNLMALDLHLLKRHAVSLGAELGLVTRNREIRAAAKKLNLPVFRRAIEAQKKPWPLSKIHRPSRRFTRVDLRKIRKRVYFTDFSRFTASPFNRILVFAAGVLAVMLVVLLLLPSAQIRLIPPLDKQSVHILVTAQDGIADVQLSGTVPKRKISQIVSGQASAQATGITLSPTGTAHGTALLMNLTDKAVSLPAGTLLFSHSNPDVEFATGQLVQVPAGKGKTSIVSIKAVQPGPAGNAARGEITILESKYVQMLAVNNPEPILGGTQSEVATATAQNKAELRSRLVAELERVALKQISDKIAPDDELFGATLQQVRVLEETYHSPSEQTEQKFSLYLQMEYSAEYASFADLNYLAGQILNASKPKGYISMSNQIQLFTDSVPQVLDDGGIQWRMRAERTLARVIDTSTAALSVQGKTPAQAAQQLMERYALTQTPEITIQPGWWPWLPYLSFRIVVSE